MGEFNAYIVPTLITGLALIIAIIGAIIRQTNFNKFVKLKKKSNSYDRRKSKTPQVRNAEIQQIVNEKVNALNYKLKALENDKSKLEQEVLEAKNKYDNFANKKLTSEEKKDRKVAKNNYYNKFAELNNTIQDITILKDELTKIKSDKYILREEYNLMMKSWREEKDAKRLEKRNSRAKKSK